MAPRSLLPETQLQSALAIAIIAAATIVGAWIFQAFGVAPCELCLQQRTAYYGGVPLAAILAYAASGRARPVVAAGFLGLALIFLANAGLAIYHSGVEWALWKGPADCTGAITAAPKVADFLKELDRVKVVRCDEVQIRILGLSLANLNVLISAALAALAARAAFLKA
jgi:disulfide bond formation protein DsbB